MLIYDNIEYCPTYGGRLIPCRVRLVEDRWNTIAVVTDLSDDIYSSITLHTDELATSICERHEIDRKRLLWIEHIPSDLRLGRNEDLWDLVHFDDREGLLSRPIWTPLTSEEVDTLTSGLLDDPVPQD